MLDMTQTRFIADPTQVAVKHDNRLNEFFTQEQQSWFSFAGIGFQSEQAVVCDEILEIHLNQGVVDRACIIFLSLSSFIMFSARVKSVWGMLSFVEDG